MTTAILSVPPSENFSAIENIFKKYPFHHLPVVNKNQSVIGIISKTDILHFSKKLALNSSGKYYSQLTLGNTKASDIMTAEPIVVDSDDTIGLAADLFLANTIHALPVVEDNRLVGIITTHDLLQYAFKEVIYGA